MFDTSIDNVLIREPRVALKTSLIFSSPGIHSPLAPDPWIPRFTDSAPNIPNIPLPGPRGGHRTPAPHRNGWERFRVYKGQLAPKHPAPPPAKGQHQPTQPQTSGLIDSPTP